MRTFVTLVLCMFSEIHVTSIFYSQSTSEGIYFIFTGIFIIYKLALIIALTS